MAYFSVLSHIYYVIKISSWQNRRYAYASSPRNACMCEGWFRNRTLPIHMGNSSRCPDRRWCLELRNWTAMPEFVHISPYPASLSLMQIADRRRSRASLGHCVTRFAPALPHSPQTQLGVENREGWSMRAVTNFGARARTSRGVALFAITVYQPTPPKQHKRRYTVM